jgi:hypothetical protein
MENLLFGVLLRVAYPELCAGSEFSQPGPFLVDKIKTKKVCSTKTSENAQDQALGIKETGSDTLRIAGSWIILHTYCILPALAEKSKLRRKKRYSLL